MYGALNWFDLSAAACGEMVFDLIARARRAADASRSPRTSTSRSSPTPGRSTTRTSRRARSTSAGSASRPASSPPAVARSIFDSNNLGRLKLFGAVLNRMQLDATGRIATLSVDQQLARDCGGTYDDTEGLINLPLTVKEILAVVFFKENGPGRLARQHALEGRRRRQRRRQGVRRRRPQERLRAAAPRGDARRRCRPLFERRSPSNRPMPGPAPSSHAACRTDGRRPRRRQAAGPDVARRRGRRAARACSEPRIGHTGTLDPLATGVLPLACGTRHAPGRGSSPRRTRTTTRRSASA